MRRQARAGELRLFSVEKVIGRVPSRRSLVCLPRLLTPPSPFVRAAPCRARARASSPPRAGVTDRVRSREYASNPFEEKLVRSGCSAAATRARPPAARIAAVAAPAASALAALPAEPQSARASGQARATAISGDSSSEAPPHPVEESPLLSPHIRDLSLHGIRGLWPPLTATITGHTHTLASHTHARTQHGDWARSGPAHSS